MKNLRIAILGFGTVGGGTYHILTENHDIIEKRTGVSVDVVKVLNRKSNPAFPGRILTTDPDDILTCPDIDPGCRNHRRY